MPTEPGFLEGNGDLFSGLPAAQTKLWQTCFITHETLRDHQRAVLFTFSQLKHSQKQMEYFRVFEALCVQFPKLPPGPSLLLYNNQYHCFQPGCHSKLLLLLCSQMPLATQPCLNGGNVSPASNRHYDGSIVTCHLRTGRLLRNASMKCEGSHFSMLEIILCFLWG